MSVLPWPLLLPLLFGASVLRHAGPPPLLLGLAIYGTVFLHTFLATPKYSRFARAMTSHFMAGAAVGGLGLVIGLFLQLFPVRDSKGGFLVFDMGIALIGVGVSAFIYSLILGLFHGLAASLILGVGPAGTGVCPACGGALRSRSRHCGQCGAPVAKGAR